VQAITSTTKTAEVDRPLKRWFYPLVTLLICLPRSGKYSYKTRREMDQPSSSRSSPDQIFRDFVSKLAFLCWTDTAPATICALAVLAVSDGVEYVLAFNNRPPAELEAIKAMLKSTLHMFQRSPSSNDAKKEILRHVLSSCVSRVRGYLKAFDKYLGECIEECARDTEADCESCTSRVQPLVSRPLLPELTIGCLISKGDCCLSQAPPQRDSRGTEEYSIQG
jgi:hypothetical protein